MVERLKTEVLPAVNLLAALVRDAQITHAAAPAFVRTAAARIDFEGVVATAGVDVGLVQQFQAAGDDVCQCELPFRRRGPAPAGSG